MRARWVSILLHPALLVPAAVAVGSGVRAPLLAALGLLAVLLAGFAVFSVRRGHASDLDFSVRAERPRLLVPALLVTAALAALFAWRGHAQAAAGSASAVGVLGVSLCANRWLKPSLHTAFAALALAFVWPSGWPVRLAFCALVPLVAWSRVALGRHTLVEVLVGGALGAAWAAALLGFVSASG